MGMMSDVWAWVWIPGTHLKARLASWGKETGRSLLSQSCQKDELQVQWETLSQRIRWIAVRHLMMTSGLHTTHTHEGRGMTAGKGCTMQAWGLLSSIPSTHMENPVQNPVAWHPSPREGQLRRLACQSIWSTSELYLQKEKLTQNYKNSERTKKAT